MRDSHLTDLRLVVYTTAALAIITIVALMARWDTTYAATFNPIGTVCLDDETTVDPDPLIPGHGQECDGDSATGAATGITGTINIVEGDSNFGAIIAFTPPEWTVARDADIPDGALVGQLNSRARLGFLNNPCNNSLPVRFNMMDATTSTATLIPFDDPDVDKDDDQDDQFDTGPDGLPLGVTRFPDYLTRIRPARSAGTPALPVPIARMYGQTVVGGIDVSLNFLMFEPGETLGNTTLAKGLGYPSLTILQSLGDPDIEPNPDNANAITDFCSPLLTINSTFAVTQDNPNTGVDEGGFAYRSNPDSDGTYNFVTWAESQIDTDGDGIVNTLDTCPFDPNPNWDPRASNALQPGVDSDADGIPDVCDPEPDQATIPPDHDGDIYFNRVDNCPTVANGLQEDNVKDSDSDGIGDACDTQGLGPNTPDGDRIALCIVSQVVIGAGGSAPDVIGQPCTADVIVDVEDTSTAGTTPTPTAGATQPESGGAVGGTDTGPSGGAETGVGALAPVAASIPIWAAIASGLGLTGILGAIGGTVSRVLRRRQRG